MSNRQIDISMVVNYLRRATREFKRPSVTEIRIKFSDPFLVLISCILSLRTKDRMTIEASKRLFKKADNPVEMHRLSVDTIQDLIYPVGFYRVKAENIKNICYDLINKFEGRVPDRMDALLSLRGVGRKTANLVMTEGFGKQGICVDTHVHRISNRLGYIKTKSAFQTEMALRDKLPKKFWREYNYLLVTWGQNICKPISPLCSNCGLLKICHKVNVNKRR
jgi:endonuclease-3